MSPWSLGGAYTKKRYLYYLISSWKFNGLCTSQGRRVIGVAIRVIILKNCFSFVTIFGKKNDHINYVGG